MSWSARRRRLFQVTLAGSISCSPFGIAPSGTEGVVVDGGAGRSDALDERTSDGSEGGGRSQDCPPSVHGPPLVRAGRVCIDQTPVTRAQYTEFFDAVRTQPFDGAFCGDQSALSDPRKSVDSLGCNKVSTPSLADDSPISCVTICDARSFCSWAGKHVCAGLDGKPLTSSSSIRADVDEWTNACTLDGQQLFPTGSQWTSAGCVVANGGRSSPASVTRTPKCEGPPGVLDLVGNVVVWVDACDTGTPNHCRTAGESSYWNGSGISGETGTGRCDRFDRSEVTLRATDLGFRCCATPSGP